MCCPVRVTPVVVRSLFWILTLRQSIHRSRTAALNQQPTNNKQTTNRSKLNHLWAAGGCDNIPSMDQPHGAELAEPLTRPMNKKFCASPMTPMPSGKSVIQAAKDALLETVHDYTTLTCCHQTALPRSITSPSAAPLRRNIKTYAPPVKSRRSPPGRTAGIK